jgi:hypothetical protein
VKEPEMARKNGFVLLGLIAIGLGNWPSAQGEESADKPLATIQGEVEGVHIDILSLKRGDNMLTLRAAFVNDSGGPVKDSVFPGVNGSGWLPVLIDYASKRKYGIIMFNDGSCLCTTNLIYNAEFEPGRKVLWAKFPAPPESVHKITLLAGSGEPIEQLPISP